MGIKKKVKDIFAGKAHSFAIDENDRVYAWGQNNQGQLGIGTKEPTHIPTRIKELDDAKIISISGGEHHTVAVGANGKVYSWGRNDEGQLGVGNLYGEWLKA